MHAGTTAKHLHKVFLAWARVEVGIHTRSTYLSVDQPRHQNDHDVGSEQMPETLRHKGLRSANLDRIVKTVQDPPGRRYLQYLFVYSR
jgi:hypothetical protein